MGPCLHALVDHVVGSPDRRVAFPVHSASPRTTPCSSRLPLAAGARS